MRPEVTNKVPPRYEACRKLANLPAPGKRGWTVGQLREAFARSRASEIEKADCLHDLKDWTEGQLGVVRGD